MIFGTDQFILNIMRTSENEALHPKDVFNEIQNKMSWHEASQKVYKILFEKYFKPTPPKAPDLVRQLKGFFPGKIYTFMYDPKLRDVLQYFDERPIMLSIKTEPINLGINFNFIPLEMKTLMINTLWDTFSAVIEYNQTKINKKQVMQQKPLFLEGYDYMELLDVMWEYTQKSAYRFALRHYLYDRMAMPKEIAYSDWGLIPFIDSKDVVGKELSEIHRLYWAYKLQQSKEDYGHPKRKFNRPKLR